MASSGTIEGLDEARAAEERARERLGLDRREDRGPAPVVDETARAIARVRRLASVPAESAPDDAERLRRQAERRVRAVVARIAEVLPAAYRLRLDSPDLALRVPSQRAIAASRMALDAPKVVWTGPTGHGKTTLACAALAAWIEAHPAGRPMYVAARTLALARSRHALGEGEPPVVERAMVADVLLIDELTAEGQGPTSAVGDVIFEREAQGRPTWITVWMPKQEIVSAFGAGIARRIFERALVIDCTVKR